MYYICLILLQLGPTRTRAAAEKRKFSPTRTVSFIQTHCSWTSSFHSSLRTVSFINLYAPFQCKSRNNQCIASCVYCSWLKVLRKTVHKKKLSKQSKRYAVHSNGYFHSQVSAFSLNYQWRNAFNPLQCSVRFLFTVVHLPTNQKDIKTEHSS